jgi:hypothetical protein
VQVEIVALLAETFRERILPALLGIVDVGPLAERARNSDAIVVYLVTTANPKGRLASQAEKRQPFVPL